MRIKYLLPLFLSVAAAAQDKPVPKITTEQAHLLAAKVYDANIAEAEVREYVADLEAKHPGYVIKRSQDGIFYFDVKPAPTPALKTEEKK